MTHVLPFFFFLAFLFTAPVQAAPIDDTRFAECSSFLRDLITPERVVEKWLPETEKLFQNIVRKYPIATSEYVLVGRSPALLAAFLEVQKEMYVNLHSWVLPISLKNDHRDERATVIRRFTRVHEAFRPQAYKDAPPRKRVYIDLTATGRTFAALDRFLIESGNEGDFLGYTSMLGNVKDGFQKIPLSRPLTFLEIDFSLESSTGEIKGVAPYSSLQIEFEEPSAQSLRPEITSKGYKQALSALQKELF